MYLFGRRFQGFLHLRQLPFQIAGCSYIRGGFDIPLQLLFLGFQLLDLVFPARDLLHVRSALLVRIFFALNLFSSGIPILLQRFEIFTLIGGLFAVCQLVHITGLGCFFCRFGEHNLCATIFILDRPIVTKGYSILRLLRDILVVGGPLMRGRFTGLDNISSSADLVKLLAQAAFLLTLSERVQPEDGW